MNKMSVVGLLVLIAALPACDNCCSKKTATPVESVVVEETVVTTTQPEEVDVIELETTPEVVEVSK